MSQRVGVRDPDRFAGGEGDNCFQRIAVEGPQRIARNIAEVRRDRDVLHRTKRMVGRRRLDIEDIDPGAGDAAFL